MNIESLLTYITPLRLHNQEDFKYFEITIRSFYDTHKERPLHNFAINISPEWYDRFIQLLQDLRCNYNILTTDENALNGFVTVADSIRTPYCFLMLADFYNIADKDIISLSVTALKKDPKLAHTILGGIPVGDYERPDFKTVWKTRNKYLTNDSHFVMIDEKLCLVHDHDYVFERMPIDEKNTLWTLPMTPNRMKYIFPFPAYYNVMRTDVLQKFVNLTKPHIKSSDTTISHFFRHGNTTEMLILSRLHIDGWPEGFEFFEDYKQGFLNCASYIYSLGRDRKTIDQYRKDHCREII